MPWTSILSVGLKLIGWFFDRAKVSKEQKEAFLRFYKEYETLGNASVRQKDDIERQLEEIDKWR